MRIKKGKIILAAVVALILVLVLLWLRSNRGYSWPVNGEITSPYGDRTHPVTGQHQSHHNGIDIGAKTGVPVKAPKKGTVNNVFYNDAGGNQVTIKHPDGFQTGYAHLSRVDVEKGQAVKKGQVIGAVGATGRVTGPHLHFTMKDPDGHNIDPLSKLA